MINFNILMNLYIKILKVLDYCLGGVLYEWVKFKVKIIIKD